MTTTLIATFALLQASSLSAPRRDTLVVAVDSSRHQVVLTAGPYDLTPVSRGQMVAMHHTPQPVLRFTWPVNGWLRGSHLVITDSAGRPLDHRLIHHLNLINFSRRQLIYPLYERLLALGEETGDISLPRTVGVPVSAGMPMGLVLMWDDLTGAPIRGAKAQLVLAWTPASQLPRPVDVLPVYMDVKDPVGHDVAFDLPAGVSSFHADYTLPVSGRMLGVGGHLHDYGTGITLEDVTSGEPRKIVSLHTRLAADGAIESVERKFPGVAGDGLRLSAGHRYRITGSYANPTGASIRDGAMVHLIYLFAPDRMGDWPTMTAADSGLAVDLARLRTPEPEAPMNRNGGMDRMRGSGR